MECKIGQVEKISHKLAQYARKRRQLGSMASGLSDFSTLFPAQNFSSSNKNNFDNNKRSLSQSRTSLNSAATAPAIAYGDEDNNLKTLKGN